MKLSILIVNWNTKKLVANCINSIYRFAPGFDYEIIVVDNASRDGSLEALRGNFSTNPEVKIIGSTENLGFAKGNNLAYERSSGEYVLLLNPDTQERAGSLEKLVGYLDAHPEAGVAGGQIINPDGTVQPSVRKFPELWSSLLMLTGLYRVLRPKSYLMDDFDYAREQAVDQVMGAVLLTRRPVIEELGFLDEGFWLWYEEVDFCYRVKRAGHRVMYCPEAVFMHLGGKSFSQMPILAKKKVMARSLFYYFRKRWQEKH